MKSTLLKPALRGCGYVYAGMQPPPRCNLRTSNDLQRKPSAHYQSLPRSFPLPLATPNLVLVFMDLPFLHTSDTYNHTIYGLF